MGTETRDERPYRSPAEVARRVLAILAVVQRCQEEDPARLRQWTEEQGIARYLSRAEEEFFLSPNPSHEDLVQFSWRAEALVPLLWSLQVLPVMPPLNAQIDLTNCVATQSAADNPRGFIASATLKPGPELDEAEEMLYHEHWRVCDAQLFDRPVPPELNPGIVYERRYAMSWIVGWGEDWDDVPTDT